MADSSGRRLCLALRCAGLAFSSGLACAIGCPGGAKGLRMESTIDALRFRCFAREDFIAFKFGANSGGDAIAAQRECQSVFRWNLLPKPRLVGVASEGERDARAHSSGFVWLLASAHQA